MRQLQQKLKNKYVTVSCNLAKICMVVSVGNVTGQQFLAKTEKNKICNGFGFDLVYLFIK
jgi:hypothetical protein